MTGPAFPSGFQWHWKAHLDWGQETLVFMFLKFGSTYDRGLAVKGLQAFMAELESISYAFYELSAPHDVLVRAWLPRELSVPRLRRTLIKAWPKKLDPAPKMPIVMETEQIVHHWPWQPTDIAEIGDMERPEKDVLEANRPARELDALNDIQRATSLTASSFPSNGLKSLARIGDIPDVRKLIDKYKGLNLITEPPYDPGIRFLILVEAEDARKNQSDRDRLGLKLAQLLDEAQNSSGQSGPRVWDRSLYSTDGEYPFLIIGRVDEAPGHFHSIGAGLVANINERLAAAGARTHTSYFQMPGFLDFRDELRVPSRPRPKPPDAGDLLARQESANFEVKGSAFAELSDFFKGKTSVPSTSTDIDNKALSSLLRAVLSMLNGEEEAHIVVGAVEAKKYPGSKRVDALPEVGNFRVCGIELDLKGNDWDRYTQRLQQVLEARISPNPMRWVHLSPSPVAGDKFVCVISISLPDEWFEGRFRSKSGAIEEHFIVRGGGAGASTKRLKTAAEIEAHKNRTRRSARWPNGD